MSKFKLPFDPKREIFRWGPVPGKFLFVSVFSEVNCKYFRKRFNGKNWSETLYLFKNSRMFFLNDIMDLRSASLVLFLKYLLPKKSRCNIYSEWQRYTKVLEALMKEIDRLSLAKLDTLELLSLWARFHNAYVNFWVDGMVPELANFGAEKYLEMKLKNYTLNQKELLLAMEALTAPGRLSFYQQEEIDLAGTKNISEHQKKYFWLKNSYNGAQLLFNDFFAERQRKVSKDIKEKMLEKMAIMEQKKLEVKKKFHLTSEIMDISKAISYGVGWQDERKKYILIVLGYQDLMLNEIARRFKYHKDDLCNAWYYEIARILKGDNLHNELKKRRPGFGVWYYKTCKNLTPQEVKYYWNTYQEKAISAEIKELKGVVASQGAKSFVKGRVKILLNPSEIKSFKDGEVLVAPMTSPEYIFAIRKASAIITDVGGLTQHAAVVSRELNIPCIVGTRNATQVLKDGDLVTLDIAKGLVKKVC